MSTPNLLYSDVETDLRASVRDLLADRCEPSALLARVEGEQPYDPALWRTLSAELGLAGLHVPESLGGQGASTRETALVLEELGRAVAPVPFLGSAVLATSVLLRADTSTEPVAALLRRLAGGEATAALVVPMSSAAGSAFPSSVRVSARRLTRRRGRHRGRRGGGRRARGARHRRRRTRPVRSGHFGRRSGGG
ncbi:alkylation response protein AidB-like acyl-CoA dehydrogenase [Saccharomonospora amisosensis]|uniref:Alkylation response protein AidB-like acyl-CoA dehydrogenase n=1 Tax=Saccharomonospora amisosensis TaxID=1128677 RepID=A0A7X5UQD9_9PSEU|nr:alkylation response protein AidB-like acyl-CoA dehydrogenase [Saccharomonospora amisosensis]